MSLIWSGFLQGTDLPMNVVDETTVSLLELTVPGRSDTEFRNVQQLLEGMNEKTIFGWRKGDDKRVSERLEKNLRRCPSIIPSFKSFFSNLKFLRACQTILNDLKIKERPTPEQLTQLMLHVMGNIDRLRPNLVKQAVGRPRKSSSPGKVSRSGRNADLAVAYERLQRYARLIGYAPPRSEETKASIFTNVDKAPTQMADRARTVVRRDRCGRPTLQMVNACHEQFGDGHLRNEIPISSKMTAGNTFELIYRPFFMDGNPLPSSPYGQATGTQLADFDGLDDGSDYGTQIVECYVGEDRDPSKPPNSDTSYYSERFSHNYISDQDEGGIDDSVDKTSSRYDVDPDPENWNTRKGPSPVTSRWRPRAEPQYNMSSVMDDTGHRGRTRFEERSRKETVHGGRTLTESLKHRPEKRRGIVGGIAVGRKIHRW